MKVHTALGPGMPESSVHACLLAEMIERGLHVQHEVKLPLIDRHLVLPNGFRSDFVVEQCLLVEVKRVETILPVHEAQTLTYLQTSGLKLALLINFKVAHLRDGIRRFINASPEEL